MISEQLNQDSSEHPSRFFNTFHQLASGKNNEFLSPNGRHVLGYTENENKAFQILKEIMEDCNLSVHTDKFGNLFGVYYPEGCNPNAQAVISGSHLDSVGNVRKTVGGGAYDGVLGVAAAVETIQKIQDENLHLNRPVAIAVWRSEESSLWGRPCLGSSLATGSLSEIETNNFSALNEQNETITLNQQIQQLQETDQANNDLPPCLQNITQSDYIELHIEQGPNVQRNEVGIVRTAIAGATRSVLELDSNDLETIEETFHTMVTYLRTHALQVDHYSTEDLKMFRATMNRADKPFNVGSAQEQLDFGTSFAFLKAEQIETYKQKIQEYLVQNFPLVTFSWDQKILTINCKTQFHTGTCPMDLREQNNLDALYISSKLYLHLHELYQLTPHLVGDTDTIRLDIRSTSQKYIKHQKRKILEALRDIATRFTVSLKIEDKGLSAPSIINARISTLMQKVAQTEGIPYRTLVSGAGHDVQKFQNGGLIFIHSQDGLSHDQAEYSFPEDMELGVQQLYASIIELASQSNNELPSISIPVEEPNLAIA